MTAKKAAPRKAPPRKIAAAAAGEQPQLTLEQRVEQLEKAVGALLGQIVAAEMQKQLVSNPALQQQLMAQVAAGQAAG